MGEWRLFSWVGGIVEISHGYHGDEFDCVMNKLIRCPNSLPVKVISIIPLMNEQTTNDHLFDLK